MIELYDPLRLERQRTSSPLRPLGLALVLTLVAVGAHAFVLQRSLHQVQADNRELEARLKRAEQPSDDPQAHAELKAEVLRLEADAAAAAALAPPEGPAISPAQWMDRLAALASREVSLRRIEIDRQGSARIEGQTTAASSLSAFVQSWERQESLAALRPRAIEVRQDKGASHLLQFQLHAAAPEARP